MINMRTSDDSIEKSESSKISPSLKTGSLLKLLCKFNGGCRPETLHIEIRKKYNENLQFLQTLTSMTNEDVTIAGIGQREFSDEKPGKKYLVTNHLRHIQFEVYPSKLASMGADRVFALRGYLRVTIRQYFYVRHHIDLIYPQLPLVCVFGGRNHQYFYPIECLDYVDFEEQKN
uniref:PAZ domain-containing protein n=2 Tax=Meloidogyne TaxID=189290 RepID=A0A914NWK5_MELIC